MPDKSNLRKDLFRLTDNAPKEAIRHKGESSKELTEGMFNTALGLFRICMFGVRVMAGIKRSGDDVICPCLFSVEPEDALK